MRTILALSLLLSACSSRPATDDRNYAAAALHAIEPKADCVSTYTHVGEHHYDHAVCTLASNSAVLECWTADNAALQCTTLKGAAPQAQAPAPAPQQAPPPAPPPAPSPAPSSPAGGGSGSGSGSAH